MISRLPVVLMIVTLAGLPLWGQLRVTYQVKDLGVLPGFSGSTANNSNWLGLVTGSQLTEPTGTPPVSKSCHAFLWNALTGMRDLGTLGTACATGRYVDGLGRVGGTLFLGTAGYRSFFWSLAGGMIDIGSLAGGAADSTVVQDMNNRGEMVGFSQEGQYSLGNPPYERAFYWSRATGMRDLGSLAGLGVGHSRAEAINDSGRIAGMSSLGIGSTGAPHAVFLESASSPMVDLAERFGIPGGSRAFHINNRNQIAGDRLRADNGRVGIFIADPVAGPVVEIGDLGFITSGTSGMNDAGQVVGTINRGGSFGDQDNQGYRWTPPGAGPAVMDYIEPLAGDSETAATSINGRGQVVGSSFTRPGPAHSILWSPTTGTTALPPLQPGGACQAAHINDLGIVSGSCADSAGLQHAVVWTPRLTIW